MRVSVAGLRMGILEAQQVADQIWRREVDKALEEHMERLDAHDALFAQGASRMTELAGKIAENTGITQAVKADTDAIVKAFKAWGGFTTVSRWILALIVGIAALIIAGGVIYWFVASGTLPHKP